MKGFCVPRRFGWDCHGLPIENEIEKAKELSGAASIEAFGIAQFNEECRGIVQRYTSEWKKTVDRMARWVDFDLGGVRCTLRCGNLPQLLSLSLSLTGAQGIVGNNVAVDRVVGLFPRRQQLVLG